MDKKAFFRDAINKSNLATISTLSPEGKPQAAVIGIGQTNDLEIIFGTFNTTRKYRNIHRNPSVALVIGWEDGKTVQYEGDATELTPEDIHLVRDNLWAKNPGTKKYYEDERQRYFIVRPTWMRYTDMTVEPRYIIEMDVAELKRSAG